MNANQMAIANVKIAPSVMKHMRWAEVKEKFAKQVKKMAGPGQRNHEAQVASGWNHIKGEVLSVQSTLQVVRYEGAAKRLMPEYMLVDGYHRVEFWLSLEDGVLITDACPFEYLNIEVHTVTAATKREALKLTDKIARTFNNKESVKRNGDFLAAAVRQAGLDAVSNGYKTGRGAGLASFLKRAIGNPDLATPDLTAIAKNDIAAHQAMDVVLDAIERTSALRALRGRIFNPGVMQALFEHFKRLTPAQLETATSQVVTTLACFGGLRTMMRQSLGAVESDLYAAFNQLCDEDFAAEIRTYGNREEQYNRVCSLLRKRFINLGKKSMGLKVVSK